METEGLVTAFREFAANMSKMFQIACAFDCECPPMIDDTATATHLYRIAQEAVNNAIRHGKPRQIVISLSNQKERVELTIEDDGGGLPDDWRKNRGLGTRIMAHRAARPLRNRVRTARRWCPAPPPASLEARESAS